MSTAPRKAALNNLPDTLRLELAPCGANVWCWFADELFCGSVPVDKVTVETLSDVVDGGDRR